MAGSAAMACLVYFHGSPAAVSFTARGEAMLVRDPAPPDQLVAGIAACWKDTAGLQRPEVETGPACGPGLCRPGGPLPATSAGGPGSHATAPGAVLPSRNSTGCHGPHARRWPVAAGRPRVFMRPNTCTNPGDLAGYVERLVEPGVATRNRDGYSPGGDGWSSAGNVLIAGRVLRREVCLPGAAGEVSRSAIVCLQAGLHDNQDVAGARRGHAGGSPVPAGSRDSRGFPGPRPGHTLELARGPGPPLARAA